MTRTVTDSQRAAGDAARAAGLVDGAPAQRRRIRRPAVLVETDPPQDDGPTTISERIVRWISGDEGAGFGISLVIHVFLLAVLAIPVINILQPGSNITTVVSDTADQPVPLAPMIDTQLYLDEAGGAASQFKLPEFVADEMLTITTDLLGDPKTSGDAAGEAIGELIEGMLQRVPENAVTAGSFTAWTTPIENKFGADPPKPGDSPRPGQKYWITIQIRVPPNRRVYSLSDLSGVVIGTDGYEQRIPYDRRNEVPQVFVVNEEGALVKPGTSIPVVNGVVQLRIWVPGAVELTKDTIEVKSRMLNEEQTLELMFQTADGRTRRGRLD